MSWINDETYPANKVYRTDSSSEAQIVVDLSEVVAQCVNQKKGDQAEEAKTILLYSNATNGHIGVYLYDLNEMDQVGNSSYLLELPYLWKLSTEHPLGAEFYDNLTKSAAQLFAQSEHGTQLKVNYKLCYVDELDDLIHL